MRSAPRWFWRGCEWGAVGTVLMTVLMILVWLIAPRAMPSLIPLAITAGLVAKITHAQAVTSGMFALGFVLHLVYGAFWGGLIALSSPNLTAAKGIVVATGLWLLMFIFYVPMSGDAVVAVATNPWTWVVTFVGHVAYGATVGALLHRDQTRGYHGEHALA
ncbi:MAG TPA: DUF6789 family protein [Kofleriaceae bacterium]|nr:DUF6789 family protein [Kofleriaceae bacterium]